MYNGIFSESDLITFTSADHLGFGVELTILNEPSKKHGKWVTHAVVAGSGTQELHFEVNKIPMDSFIVLRSLRTNGRFTNSAVQSEKLEQSSEKLECETIDLLRHAQGRHNHSYEAILK